MAGSNVEDIAGRGINYRALDDLFNINEERRGEVRSCTVTCGTSRFHRKGVFLRGSCAAMMAQ
jgi:hypothetical protein